jgi:YfiH family protein
MAPFTVTAGEPWPLGTFAALAAEPGLRHGVTTRAGPAFGRDGASAESAAAAAAAAAALDLEDVAWTQQVHGGTVLRVRDAGLAGEADGLVTDRPGLAVLGRGADCPLVLVAGRRPDGTAAVGFAHASWRSTVRGITATVLQRLREELGVDPATVTAGIAPSAGPCCYEVGPEVREEALDRLGTGAARFFAPVGEGWHLDLWSANLAQLTAAGVPAARVFGSGLCTICQGERFWSWRAQGEAAGRFAALIGVAPGGA